MKKKTVKIAAGVAALLILMAAAVAGGAWYLLYAPQFFPPRTAYIYIDRNDNIDSVYHKVQEAGCVRRFEAFIWMADYRRYAENIRTGRYAIKPGESVYHVFSRLLRGYQEPTNLTMGSVRTLDRLAASMSRQLMIDSAEIASLMNDSAVQARLGFNRATMPALFLPDTYQVYWDITANDLMERIKSEYDRFWTPQRQQKADAMGLTRQEVSALASIVEEETNNAAEKPVVAGIYVNRLKKRMPLQACPTVKFALGDFGLQRILNKDLQYDSPYNTYLYPGLPPGPIRIPSKAGLDAVLDHAQHSYLYLCAREDFSGTHRFATTYGEHLRNAQIYQDALNRRKIKR